MMRAVLTDFGVCQVLASATTVTGLTINVVTGKSMAYSSPEILQPPQVPLTPDMLKKRDVYAGSCILNELVTRQMAWHPLPVGGHATITYKIFRGERPDMTVCELLAGD